MSMTFFDVGPEAHAQLNLPTLSLCVPEHAQKPPRYSALQTILSEVTFARKTPPPSSPAQLHVYRTVLPQSRVPERFTFTLLVVSRG